MTELDESPSDGDQRSEYERLVCPDRIFNPTAWQMLSTAGARAGWRVADVTPSSGRLTSELAAADMDVVGLDQDTHVAEHSEEHDRVQWTSVDITREDNPSVVGAGFDAIHARTVLAHLPARRGLVPRLTSWLKPGGWLIIGEFVWVSLPAPSRQYTAALRAAAGDQDALGHRGPGDGS